jgi:beta-fructofuranosidase
VLIVSVLADGTTRDAAAAVGNYRAGRLDIDAWFPPTHGPGHYAPTTFLDADGQPCVLFWIRDVADVDGGWSGALSIPYRLSLTANRVALTPHPVLAKARPDPHRTLGFTWRPRDADGARLSLRTDDGSAVLDLVLEQDVLTVATPAAMVTAPLTGTATTPAVQVLVDGCVLEVMTGDAVVGLPVVGLPDLRAAPESITPWWR